MNDKIKWFGRYLGCNFVYRYHTGNWNKSIVGTASIMKSALPDKYECKLILKELKDISDEDLKGLMIYLDNDFDFLEFDKNTICAIVRMLDDDYHEVDHYCLGFDQEPYDYQVVDFLRSKGYAIGIPKEFYITEDEL